MLVTGAGQISMAIARRIGFGKKIMLDDKKIENVNAIAKTIQMFSWAIAMSVCSYSGKPAR